MPDFGSLSAEPLDLGEPFSDAPFRVAVLADLSGRANRGEASDADDIAGRKLQRVNRDNFDEFFAKLAPRLRLPLDGDDVEITFGEFDDFQPDPVINKVGGFDDLFSDKSDRLNTLLAHADFRGLESAWRGLDWLLRRVQADRRVHVVPVDLSFAEMTADLTAADDLAECGLYKLLAEKGVMGPKGEPWALVVADYLFDDGDEHAGLLGRLARLAANMEAPLVTGGAVAGLDGRDPSPAWTELRRLKESASLGVALPRFLLRVPYGDSTRSIDSFDFEEFDPHKADRVGQYLWGNAAWAVAAVLAADFGAAGWAMRPGASNSLGGMVLHAYTHEDEVESALLERWLDARAADRAAKRGYMPLMGVKNRDQAQLSRVLSVAEREGGGNEPLPLAGRWTATAPPPTFPGVSRPGAKTSLVAPAAGAAAGAAAAGGFHAATGAAAAAPGGAGWVGQDASGAGGFDINSAFESMFKKKDAAAGESEDSDSSDDYGSSDDSSSSDSSDDSFGSSDDSDSTSDDSDSTSDDSSSSDSDDELAKLMADLGGDDSAEKSDDDTAAKSGGDDDDELAKLLADLGG